jgi:polygalacturonase
MKTMNINTITLIITIAFLVLFSSFENCSAIRGNRWRKLKASSSTFNVLDFGAKGDGRADDTKVILKRFISLFWLSI